MKCFHHNDLDGKGAASLVFLKHGLSDITPNDFISLDYKIPVPTDIIEQDEIVYILDYSFTEKTKSQLDDILEKTKKVFWLDHHVSSIRFLEKYPKYYDILAKIIIDNNRSGAMITYNYLYPYINNVPGYIKYIDDYDRWVHKYNKSLLFKLYMDSVPNNPSAHIWKDLFLGSVNYNNIVSAGNAIKNFLNNVHNEDAKEICYESEIEGLKCIVINKYLSGRSSTLLGNQFDAYKLSIVWTFDGDNYTYSLYSKSDDIDCSKIAEKFGGGGHKKAAGFVHKDFLLKRKVGC